jgi:hypothetical protein
MITKIDLVDLLMVREVIGMKYNTNNCLSLLRPEFNPKSVHMRFVADKAAQGQVLF